MRSPLPACLAAIALVAGGCAAAMPGYVPPSEKRDRMVARIQTGGGFDEQGVYHLSDQEKQLDCRQLTGSVTIKILQMRDAVNRKGPTAVAALAQNASRPVKGTTTHGVDVDVDYAQDRARLEALNRQLAAKDCRKFDIEAELKPGNTERPRPVGEAKPKAKPKG